MAAKSYIFSHKIAYEFVYFIITAWHLDRPRGPSSRCRRVPHHCRRLYLYKTRKFDTGSDILEEKTTVNLAMRL